MIKILASGMVAFAVWLPFLLQHGPHVATDCTVTEIQEAIDAAEAHAQAFEKVTIPGPCDETHTTQITVEVPSGTVFWIQGAGEGITELSDNLTKDGDSGDPWLFITGVDSTNKFRLSDFTFTGLNGTNNNRGHIEIYATSASGAPNVRFDHITIADGQDPFILFGGFGAGCTFGLVDQVDFFTTGEHTLSTVFHSGCGGNRTIGYGDGSWSMAVVPGSWDAVYFENNTISHPLNNPQASMFSFDQFEGSRVVIRFNEFYEATVGSHGWAEGGRRRGMMWLEAYGNLFDCQPTTLTDNQFWLRGGSALIFNNAVTDCSTTYSWNSFLKLSDIRTVQASSSIGLCDGMNDYDENALMTGWRCADQVGTSTSNLLDDVDPPTPVDWVGNIRRPMYIWENTLNQTPTFGVVSIATDNIAEDRDYFYDGTGGVIVDVIANIPAMCDEYQAFWATDEGKLYRCDVGGDAWTFYWEDPGAHPLANEAVWTEGASSGTSSGRMRRIR